MRWKALILVFLAAVFGAASPSIIQKMRKKMHPSTLQKIQVKETFRGEEKPFVFLICSYNNEKYYEKNLHSALEQDYRNYRIVYIDDCSTDQTYALVSEYIKKYPERKVELIRNPVNQGMMSNAYHAINRMKNEEIVIFLDGDDWLPHDQVLKILNTAYQNPDVWLTYGQHLEYPNSMVGFCKPLRKKDFLGDIRKQDFIFSHLKTAYAGLFKQIKKEDLELDGRFVSMAPDVAFMYPMLEMARDHAFFLSNILYVYNMENPAAEWRRNLAMQDTIAKVIQARKPYKMLSLAPWETQ